MRLHGLRRTLLPLSTAAALVLGPVAVAPAAAHTTPTLVGVRYAAHPGFDRVVFDFAGGLPAWSTAYGPMTSDGSGEVVPVAGAITLGVRMWFAQAHDENGAPTVPTTVDPMLPSIRQIRLGNDFEGYVGFGLGLRERVPHKVFTLSSPPRVVVDVTHPVPFRTAAVSRPGTLSDVTVSGLRAGRHPGFDRLVLDVRGTALPAYSVRYIPDTAVLLVTLSGPGTASFTGSSVWPALPGLRSARLVSRSGGTLVFRVATAKRHGFRVGTLRSPTRGVLDVAH